VLVLGYNPKGLPSSVFRVICSTAGRGEPHGEDQGCRKDGFPGRASWEVEALGRPFL